jgi:hypothetical protein
MVRVYLDEKLIFQSTKSIDIKKTLKFLVKKHQLLKKGPLEHWSFWCRLDVVGSNYMIQKGDVDLICFDADMSKYLKKQKEPTPEEIIEKSKKEQKNKRSRYDAKRYIKKTVEELDYDNLDFETNKYLKKIKWKTR